MSINNASCFDAWKIGKSKQVSGDKSEYLYTVFYKGDTVRVKTGYNGTPVIFYITGLVYERAGTASDEDIVNSMLGRGFIVVWLRPIKNTETNRLGEWELQAIRQKLLSEKFLSQFGFPQGEYPENFIVPSGCDVSLRRVFWNIRQHSAAGTLEKIVQVWNNDFCGVKGEQIICWGNSGGRKKIKAASDGTLPVWLGKDGCPNENGRFIKIKYTYAENISDCVKSDGTPVDMNLYMHIIYPVKPKKRVPVMCLASSTEHLATGATGTDRPHFLGFLLRGYAGVMYDYGYVPMARNDHYGYFDGNAAPGHVTGDNVTYSLEFYNAKKINTSAMRYIRKLSHRRKYNFDERAVGVIGNSKGGWMTFLGEKVPDAFAESRYFPNHHGETYFEIGEKGSEQPWTIYRGKEISSNANFIYASCGGNEEYITQGHAPTFVSCNAGDGIYASANTMANLCRVYDVPSLCLEANVGHTFACGLDLRYGIDCYQALFDFAGYYLKKDTVKLLYADAQTNRLKFSGSVSDTEMRKVRVSCSQGEAEGRWRSSYGKTEWQYFVDNPDKNAEYRVVLPANLQADNGTCLGKEYSLRFCGGGIRQPDKNDVCKIKRTRVFSVSSLVSAGWTPAEYTSLQPEFAPDGTPALQVSQHLVDRRYFHETFYDNHMPVLSHVQAIGLIGSADFGRRFRIILPIYDEISRRITVELSSCTSAKYRTADYHRVIGNFTSQCGRWVKIVLDYTVYDALYKEAGEHIKYLLLRAETSGNLDKKFFLGDLTVEELIPPDIAKK